MVLPPWRLINRCRQRCGAVDFYTVSHNINAVKEFIAKWYKKVRSRPLRQDSTRPPRAKRRGRPRAYEPDVALGKALDLFRKDGFAATSLDDLSPRPA